jgi:uncharacterized protein
MKMDNSVKVTGLIVMAVVIVALIVSSIFLRLSPTETVTTNGMATVSVDPDLISINFDVQTSAATAKAAKDSNALIVSSVKSSLMSLGVPENKIITQNFNVNEDFDWRDGSRFSLGFKANHFIRVEISANDSDLIGDVIDAGVDSGALLSYINFELSPELQNQYKVEALGAAAEDAKIKAKAIADGLGVKVGRVVSTTSSDFGYRPWLAYDGVASDRVSGAEIETEIQPGEQDVTAQVSVTYKLV